MSHGGSIRGDGGVHGPHQVVSQSLITDFSGRREGDTEEHFHLDSFSVVLVSTGGFRSTSMWVEWNLRESHYTRGLNLASRGEETPFQSTQGYLGTKETLGHP